jgi:hypothetical protein
MALVVRVITGLLVVALVTAPAAGQEASDSWLDGEALMLNMLDSAALDEGVLEQFHPDCRITSDGVMTRHVTMAQEDHVRGPSPCRGAHNWEGVRRYVGELTARNDTTARFMRPSGIGAPWMVRYAVRCRQACRGDMVGFEIRFTYDGQRVTRVELQAR